MGWLSKRIQVLEDAGLDPRSKSLDLSLSQQPKLPLSSLAAARPASFAGGVPSHRAAAAAAAQDGSDTEPDFESQHYLGPADAECSHHSSVRTPADLSHEPSAAAAVGAASAGSQQHLPNLLLTEDELISAELSGVSSVSETLKGLQTPNSSCHSHSMSSCPNGPDRPGLQISVSSCGRLPPAGHSAAGVALCSPAAAAAAAKGHSTDGRLPIPPKSCSHSNLRATASWHNAEWKHGSGNTSGGSSGSSMGDTGFSSYCNSAAESSADDVQAVTPSGVIAAGLFASGPNGGCSFSGSKQQSSSGSSYSSSSSNVAAAAAAGGGFAAEDEDVLLAEMDACLGSLQNAVTLARADSQGACQLLHSVRQGSVSGAAAAAAVISSSRSSCGRSSSNAGCCEYQRSKSRLRPGSLSLLSSAQAELLPQAVNARSCTCSGSMLLIVGNHGRSVMLSEPGHGSPQTLDNANCADGRGGGSSSSNVQRLVGAALTRSTQEDLEEQCLAEAAAFSAATGASSSPDRNSNRTGSSSDEKPSEAAQHFPTLTLGQFEGETQLLQAKAAATEFHAHHVPLARSGSGGEQQVAAALIRPGVSDGDLQRLLQQQQQGMQSADGTIGSSRKGNGNMLTEGAKFSPPKLGWFGKSAAGRASAPGGREISLSAPPVADKRHLHSSNPGGLMHPVAQQQQGALAAQLTEQGTAAQHSRNSSRRGGGSSGSSFGSSSSSSSSSRKSGTLMPQPPTGSKGGNLRPGSMPRY